MEPRAQKYHRERLIESFREEIITILAGELADPRIGLVTVTDLVMGEGGRSMRVFVSVDGTEEEANETMEGLAAAIGYIRHELGENLGLRKVPDLYFHLDKSEKYGDRISQLLGRLEKRTKKQGPEKP
jgi:ribosome-binding factor A